MKKVWGIFWTIEAASGGFALWRTWQLPSESKNAFLLGMSKSRIALCAGLFLLILCCIAGAVHSFRNKDNLFSSGKAAGITSFLLLFALALGLIFLTPPVGKTALERSLSERLFPAACWGALFSVLGIFLLVLQKFSELWRYQTSSVSALIWGIITFLLMSGAVFYALSSGTGLTPVSATFYRQGVSLLEGHLVVPLLFAYPLIPLFLLISRNTSSKKAGTILTIVSCLLIWSSAVWIWQTTPFEGRSYFAPALRLPNYNFYPASDAENYDLLAQSILLGNGFRNGMTVVRPLYAAFLAFLHFIFGNEYMRVTNGQILLLGLIPMLVFLIAQRSRHSAAGLVAAAWVIWREVYSIRVTPLVQVSNSRLLMSDLPSMLLITVIILSAVNWYRTNREETHALLCGGMIGTAMLLRTQFFVLIPALWLIFVCTKKKTSKKSLSILFSILGVIIVFAPWTIWGKIHPNTTADPNVSEDQYLISLYRNAVNEKDTEKGLLQLITEHPAESFEAVSAHFLNNEISSLLILPVRLIKPAEADQLFYEEDLFWYRENARETIESNRFLIIFYILMISFGIISAVRKNGFGGLIPFVIHIVYNLGNAFALTSGFRFILPVDWILLFYFAFGCIALLELVDRICLFGFCKAPVHTETIETDDLNLPSAAERNIEENIISDSERSAMPSIKTASNRWPGFSGAVILLALIGAILPLSEKVIPRRFEPKTSAQIKAEWDSASSVFSFDPGAYAPDELIFLEGRAFYPRFYKAGEGDSGGSSSAKRGLDYDRMVWMFHDQKVHVLSCPLTEEQVHKMTTDIIPDPMDVKVAGLLKDDHIEVLEMRRFED